MIFSFFENYAGLFIYPIVALLLSLVLTRLCVRVLPLLGYIDKPGGRHIHKRLVPRGGGIAVVIAFFVALMLFLSDSKGHIGDFSLFWRLFVPGVMIAALGMVDDRYALRSWVKLIVQLVVVFIVWLMGHQSYSIGAWQVPWFLSLGLSAVWIIIIINAFNLIDGLDGLASGLSVVSSVCMACWFLMVGNHSSEAVCMLILAGACLGFLHYNFHPARIFLGDTGSTFLGLVFAVVGLSTVDKAVTVTSLVLPMLAGGGPLFYVILAVWRRSARKLLDPTAGGIMDGDQDHLHHRLFRQNKKQTTTAVTMYLIACVFAVIALLFLTLRNSAPAIAYIILLLAVLIVIRRLAIVELFDSAMLIQRGLAKPRKGMLVNMIHPFIDFFMISCSYIVTSLVVFGQFEFFRLYLLAAAPIALLLCFSRVYRVYWLRAGLNNFWHLGVLVFCGSVISCMTVFFFGWPEVESELGLMNLNCFFAWALLFTLLNLTMISLERFVLHYGEGFWFRKLYLQYQDRSQVSRCVIYGGGLKCRLYINFLFCANRLEAPETVLGIIDDDIALRGLRVYGFKVLGCAAEIEAIYRETPFDKVVVATDSASEENLMALRCFCAKKQIHFHRFNISETELFPAQLTDEAVAVDISVKS